MVTGLATLAGVWTRLPAAIPSPSRSGWFLGPIPIRAYALAILAGIVAALLIGQRRLVARGGGTAEDALEITFWAVPFGIVGARIYHVITTPEPYWGAHGNPIRVLYIWEGGLGIWGAIALGGLGAWIGCRRQNVSFAAFTDAMAPGLLVAQAIGRLGNWFNQELFGSPTTLPWGLRVSADAASAAGYPPGTLFHPTFLYELLWNLAAAALLVYLDRRWRLDRGRVFWLYVFLYTLGRGWIEALRIDTAHRFYGLRLNDWMSIVVGTGALVAFVLLGRLRGSHESAGRGTSERAREAGFPGSAAESGDRGEQVREAGRDRRAGGEGPLPEPGARLAEGLGTFEAAPTGGRGASLGIVIGGAALSGRGGALREEPSAISSPEDEAVIDAVIREASRKRSGAAGS